MDFFRLKIGDGRAGGDAPFPADNAGLAEAAFVERAFASAKAGGAPVIVAASRVTFWGALAMAVTAGAGSLFGARS